MNLYLSCLLLNPCSRRCMNEMRHPYEMHRTLMKAFPDAPEEARRTFGVLFRGEYGDYGKSPKLYVHSLAEPDWSFLEDSGEYFFPHAPEPWKCRNIGHVYQKIRKGNRFAFRLRANPVKRIARKDDPMRGKRVELTREEEQIQWLLRKGNEREKGIPGGFELLCNQEALRNEASLSEVFSVTAKTEGKVCSRKKCPGKGHGTTHLGVLFEGALRVTDAEAFRQTLIRGIGPAKAYGFGLLSLAPLRT